MKRTLLAVCALASCSLLIAQPPPPAAVQPQGAGTGAGMQQARPQMMPEGNQVMRAARTLDLTPEQKTKLQELQKSTAEKVKAIQNEMKPKMDAVQKESADQVKSMLTAEQKVKFDAELEKLKNAPPPQPGAMMGQGGMMQQGAKRDGAPRAGRRNNKGQGPGAPNAGPPPDASAPPPPPVQ